LPRRHRSIHCLDPTPTEPLPQKHRIRLDFSRDFMSRRGRNSAVPSAHHSCCRLVGARQLSPAGDGWAGPTRTPSRNRSTGL
jgi:hypothetical protein